MAMLSRVADSLYWMSRYLERAEHTARLLDVTLHQLIDVDAQVSQQRWLRLWQTLHYDDATTGSVSPQPVIDLFTTDGRYADSIAATITAARENARQVREHISSEMWEQINRLYLDMRAQFHQHAWQQSPHRFFASIKMGSHLFQGITDATMSHNEGWDFIQIGRTIERAHNTASLLVHHTSILQGYLNDGQSHHAEWTGLLKMCSAFEAYCKVHTPEVTPPRLIEFVVYNPDFPRSIRFCADSIHLAAERILQRDGLVRGNKVQRSTGQFQAMLEYGGIDEGLQSVATDLHQMQQACFRIDAALRETHIAYPITYAMSST